MSTCRVSPSRNSRAKGSDSIFASARAGESDLQNQTRPKIESDPISMQLDPPPYLRLTAPNCLGTSASGAAFATSTGDVLEITCFGAGIFLMRVGPNTKPAYGLVTG